MKRHYYYLLLLPYFLLYACQPAATTEESPAFSSLEGTWHLVSFRTEDDTTWQQHAGTVIYEKYITPTHFCWVSYDTEKDSLLGTGGGTYVFDSVAQTYTEDIHFFLPAGSNEMGQAIPFEAKNEDGKWHHIGYAKIFEFDPETGENVVVDSSRIDEIWERTTEPSSNENLVGTWHLESYKGDGDSIRSDYPEFVSYMKLVTPTHFLWVHYIAEQDLVLAEGGGTYQFDGANYTETLNLVYPGGSGQVGTVLPFECAIENGDSWIHQGYIKVVSIDESGQSKVDSSRIDEVWKKYQPQM